MTNQLTTLKWFLVALCIVLINLLPKKRTTSHESALAANGTMHAEALRGIECLFRLQQPHRPITWQQFEVSIVYSPNSNCSQVYQNKLKSVESAVFRVQAMSTYEIVTTMARYKANGQYTATFTLSFPTKYTIIAILTYANGGHLEMRRHVLPILRQVPGSPLSLTCRRNTQVPKVIDYCTANESGTVNGRWVKCGHSISGLERCGPWQSDKNFDFDRLHGFRWVPYKCQHHQYTNDELKRCLARRRLGSIVFAGDSHMRYRAYHWATRLYGSCHACVKTHIKMVFNKVPRIEWIFDARGTRLPLSIQNITLPHEKYMHPKVRRSKFSAPYPSEAIESDLFLVNFGHWVLRESADVEFIEKKLMAFARGLQSLRAAGKHVVWINTVSLPWRTDQAVVEWRENTSPSRVKHFNAIADAIVRRHGIPVIDAFQISDGRVMATHDQTHFTKKLPGNDYGGVVENAISNAIMNQLCNEN